MILEIYKNVVVEATTTQIFKIEFVRDGYVNSRFLGGVLQNVDIRLFVPNSEDIYKTNIYPLCELNDEWVGLLEIPPHLLDVQSLPFPQLSVDLKYYLIDPNTLYFKLVEYIYKEPKQKVLKDELDRYLKIIRLTYNDLYIIISTEGEKQKSKLIIEYLNFVYPDI